MDIFRFGVSGGVCAIGSLVALLGACALKNEVAPINLHPSDEVIIYGALPVDQGLDLRMTARFESKDHGCGNFVDVSHVYQLSETVTLGVQKTEDRYEVRFFRDAIAKGECDWTFIYATAEVVDKDGGTAWRTFYSATPEELKKKRLERLLHEEEDHLFKVSCSRSPEAVKGLDCGVQAIYLIPGVRRYHVDYVYEVR